MSYFLHSFIFLSEIKLLNLTSAEIMSFPKDIFLTVKKSVWVFDDNLEIIFYISP